MNPLSDIEIARQTSTKDIDKIAETLDIDSKNLIHYGKNKAKLMPLTQHNKQGKLVLVTAISPTPAGEGKTTVMIGLADALKRLGKKTAIAMREPSLGPVFGIKGGAAGGGYAQVVPMEDINLHFTGDMHAIGAANNLLAAMLDNHIFQGNRLDIDVNRIVWRRAVDMNDRQLRSITDGLGGRMNGVPREDGFDITVASEVMAIFCLATDLSDLKKRLGDIVVAYSHQGKPITARDLKAHGAMCALLKDAFNPNLVQTLEGTPALVHGGPFANIAHGCNSIIATKAAMSLADITVTEAGFGADLGAEKFLHIKCRQANIQPDAVVLVATIRALKYQGGVPKNGLAKENLPALARGIANLSRHIDNITQVFGLSCVVAINAFVADTPAELALLQEKCRELGVQAALTEVWEKGGVGGEALAKEVLRLCDMPSQLNFCYPLNNSLPEKIQAVAEKIYRADEVYFTKQAEQQIQELTDLGYGHLPVCLAKTQYSFSDNPKLLGAPKHFSITVRQLKLSAGAGFVVALTGDVMTMPGLPIKPAAEQIDVDEHGQIMGLF